MVCYSAGWPAIFPVRTLTTAPQSISVLRERGWKDVPSSPGVYWWYFPVVAIDDLYISDYCKLEALQLRWAPNGYVCLYHGRAKNLRERLKWHATQRLRMSALSSGFLSTFRFTLLALNDFNYLSGEKSINDFFDTLFFGWLPTSSRDDARHVEQEELHGNYQYPLNISSNPCVELVSYIQFVKARRKEYKRKYTDE